MSVQKYDSKTEKKIFDTVTASGKTNALVTVQHPDSDGRISLCALFRPQEGARVDLQSNKGL